MLLLFARVPAPIFVRLATSAPIILGIYGAKANGV